MNAELCLRQTVMPCLYLLMSRLLVLVSFATVQSFTVE